MAKMKALVFTYNPDGYRGGNYHKDLLNALKEKYDCYVYGPGIPSGQNRSLCLPGYSESDTIDDVISKSGWSLQEIDRVFCTTLWDRPGQDANNRKVDPHPNINLRAIPAKKIFFINKEYINFKEKIKYANDNRFDLVVSVLPESFFDGKGLEQRVVQSHFGIDSGFKFNNDDWNSREIDLMFTGSLHKQYTTLREAFKKVIFRSQVFPSNRGIFFPLNYFGLLNSDYRRLNVYWAEWSRLSIDLRGNSLLPTGIDYQNLMRRSKFVFNTLSADGILGTRFFEVMASGSINLVPSDNYYGLLSDMENCVVYESERKAIEKITHLIRSPRDAEKIVQGGLEIAREANYSARLDQIEMTLNS